ncbi:MAG: tRNA (adenosine(37)-N6)-threonylcarbamoyltransferase complex ATPase subunit type 1 TsaE [Actinomycetes bacterium]
MVELGRRLAGLMIAGDLVVLDGDLGAGKTTFTRGLGHALGVRGSVTSPTFVIARVHPSLVAGPDLVHVDAYRLVSAGDVDSLDLDDSMERSVTVVEWGAGRVEQLADSWLSIRIDRDIPPLDPAPFPEPAHVLDGDGVRLVRVSVHGPAWRARMPSVRQRLDPLA